MNKQHISAHDFNELLINAIKQASLLVDLLKEEYQSLQAIQPENLELLIRKKQLAIDALQIFSNQQDLLLENQGYSSDREGIESYLTNLSNEPQLKQKWSDLQILLEKCQQQNEINSRVIAIGTRQTANALDLLYGLAAGSKTYARTGESCSERQSNSLGKA
jgi:flagella synthesis protein FlgN